MNDELIDALATKTEEVLLRNKDVLEELWQVKDAAEWYRKAEEVESEPGTPQAMVINKIIGIAKKIFPLEFLNVTFNTVFKDKGNTHLDWTYKYQLPSIKPSVEFELKMISPPLRSRFLKVIFQVESSVQVEGDIISNEQKIEQVRVKKIGIKCEFALVLKMILGQKKKKVNEFELFLENITVIDPRG